MVMQKQISWRQQSGASVMVEIDSVFEKASTWGCLLPSSAGRFSEILYSSNQLIKSNWLYLLTLWFSYYKPKLYVIVIA